MAAAGVAPLDHWHSTGWREGRDPNAGFDTRYYLAGLGGALPPGMDPLQHYVAVGRDERRDPAPPPSVELRAMLAALARAPPVAAPRPAATLTADALATLLARRLLGRRLLCLSVGHDAFPATTGGVQLVTAAEQLRVAGDHGAHLHLSPVAPGPNLLPRDGPAPPLRLLLDGSDVGTAPAPAVWRAVAGLSPAPELRLVVHSLLGHRPEDFAGWASAVATTCWLHDYATLCAAPQLLRNGYAFCGAPPVGSGACQICVDGPGRADAMGRSLALFLRSSILAPSETARATWSAGAGVEPSRVVVRPHVELVAATTPLKRPALARGAAPRVAIAGTAGFHKGRDHALRLLASHADFDWFVAGGVAADVPPGAVHLPARTSPGDPWALSRAVAGAAVDLVLVPSPWPETFCLVAHEALAAGCDVLTLSASGHAAAMVEATGRGVVFDDVASISRWLAASAPAHVAARRESPPQPLTLRWSGETGADPDPLLLDGGRVFRPERVDASAWRWTLPPACHPRMRLRSRWFVPNWHRPEPYDDRRLGLNVRAISLDGGLLDLGSALGEGWHPPDGGGRWTDGDAELDVGGATSVVLRVRGGARYPVFR